MSLELVGFSSNGTSSLPAFSSTVQVWNEVKGFDKGESLKHPGEVLDVVFLSVNLIVIGYRKKHARIWNVSTEELINYKMLHDRLVVIVAVSPLLVDNVARIWSNCKVELTKDYLKSHVACLLLGIWG